MQIYHHTPQLTINNPQIATIGMYDGVHLAHKEILSLIAKEAKLKGCESMLITFDPHPRKILNKNAGFSLLTTLNEKIELVSACGIDNFVIIPFDFHFSEISASDFVDKILNKQLNVKHLIIGYDHHFGKNREGNLTFLMTNQEKFGITVEEIDKQKINERVINSTDIRNALNKGEIEVANQLLGRNYQLVGIVIKGKQLGRTIGFPTANIQLPDNEKLIPQPGVYAVKVKINDSTYKGMMNIGFKPTFGEHVLSIEVHIFDFNSDIYNKDIIIYFVKKLRNEIKFENIGALKDQLAIDKTDAMLVMNA
ncbi:MAG: bifunctional riboflavin kinase/FAD synthetase [Bacteroidota bacterium]|nr:bifunctional riboflavin kinase/FAD synthetase [Bacteroidota bacterium]